VTGVQTCALPICADSTFAQHTYNRTKQLAADKFATQSKLDEDTDALILAQRRLDQAKLAYEEAVRGFTAEEHQIAEANVARAAAKVETTKALVDQLRITPIASQVYQIPAEEGGSCHPRTAIDIAGRSRFSLREDLIAGLKLGDRFTARIPVLGSRQVTAEVRVIASKGEYAGWRATRATGDFDLRTFAIRAYPVGKVDGLRPGMSVTGEKESNETAAAPEPGAGCAAGDPVLFGATAPAIASC